MLRQSQPFDQHRASKFPESLDFWTRQLPGGLWSFVNGRANGGRGSRQRLTAGFDSAGLAPVTSHFDPFIVHYPKIGVPNTSNQEERNAYRHYGSRYLGT